jgi:hypothetical protein
MEVTSMVHDDDDRDDRGSFMPTPEQIREQCRLIQATWSADEEIARRRYRESYYYADPIVEQAARAALDERMQRQRGRMVG